MCKLCTQGEIERPPLKIKYNSKHTTVFIKIVNEYILSNPCKYVVHHFLSRRKTKDWKGIDNFIYNKLKNTHIGPYKRETRKLVHPGVTKITASSGEFSYQARMPGRTSKGHSLGMFDTISEAKKAIEIYRIKNKVITKKELKDISIANKIKQKQYTVRINTGEKGIYKYRSRSGKISYQVNASIKPMNYAYLGTFETIEEARKAKNKYIKDNS